MDDYEARVASELSLFDNFDTEAYSLPPIVDVWAVKSVLPLIEEAGYSGIDPMWKAFIAEQCRGRAPEPARLVSLGAGSGETELAIARELADEGILNLELELIELSDQQLELARERAADLGLADRVTTLKADLNTWTAAAPADVYFANQSLHHIVELEHVFDEVRRSLRPDGVLLVNDMIGRNGHRRWPEAAAFVHPIWDAMPEQHRWNKFTEQPEPVYPDTDHAAYGFEGVRAQDVLRLLLDAFHPEVFLAFGNVIDPFIDRQYAARRDPESQEDRDFIEAVARFDDAALDLGLVSPTHLLATFRVRPVELRCPRLRTPERMLRRPRPEDEPPTQAEPPTDEPQADEPPADGPDGAAELEALRRSAEEGWGRYNDLRRRRAVRAALWLARVRNGLRG